MNTVYINIIFLIFIFLLAPNFASARYNTDNVLSAARAGNIELVTKLLEGKTGDKHLGLLNNVLAQAIVGQHYNIIEMAIERGADVNHLSALQTPILLDTIMQDRSKAAMILLENGADPNVRGYTHIHRELRIHWDWTALMCAAHIGDKDLIQLLLDKGADPMAIGWSTDEAELESSADIAAYSGKLAALKYLIKLDVPIHEHTFYKVARSGHLNVLKFMLPYLKDINQPGPFRGRPLLIEAAWWGQPRIVEFLLDEGADIDATDAYGYTAISEITDKMIDNSEMQLKIARILIERGADLNKPSETNIRPYDRAAHNQNEKLRLLLKENGAEPTLLEN